MKEITAEIREEHWERAAVLLRWFYQMATRPPVLSRRTS
jgi:hypothetical protein